MIQSPPPAEGKTKTRRSAGLSKNPVRLPYGNKARNDDHLLRRNHRAIILQNIWKMLTQLHRSTVDGWDADRVKALLPDAEKDLSDVTSDEGTLYLPFPYQPEQESVPSKVEFRRQVNWDIKDRDGARIGLFLVSTLGLPSLKNIQTKLATNPNHQRVILVVDHVVPKSSLQKKIPNILIYESWQMMFDFANSYYPRQAPQREMTREEMESDTKRYGRHFPVVSLALTPSLASFYGFHVPKMIRYRRASENAAYIDVPRTVLHSTASDSHT